MKHLFFSGRDDFNKSELIDGVLENIKPRYVEGFRIHNCNSVIPGAVSERYIHDIKDEHPDFDEKHLIGVLWDDGLYTAFPEIFDQTGNDILNNISNQSELIVMDEIGLFEMAAPLYSAQLLKKIDGLIPILGVLKREDTPFHNIIRNNDDVMIIEVVPELKQEAIEKACLFFEK